MRVTSACFWFLCFCGGEPAASADTCSHHEAERRHSLLQKVSRDIKALEIDDEDIVKSGATGIGQTAPLDEEGYQAVAKLCCEDEMTTYIERVVKKLGYKICNQYGLIGFVPWYVCGANAALLQGQEEMTEVQTYKKLVDNLKRSVPPVECAFLAPLSENCPASYASCHGSNDFANHRRRICKSVPSTTDSESTTAETTTMATATTTSTTTTTTTTSTTTITTTTTTTTTTTSTTTTTTKSTTTTLTTSTTSTTTTTTTTTITTTTTSRTTTTTTTTTTTSTTTSTTTTTTITTTTTTTTSTTTTTTTTTTGTTTAATVTCSTCTGGITSSNQANSALCSWSGALGQCTQPFTATNGYGDTWYCLNCCGDGKYSAADQTCRALDRTYTLGQDKTEDCPAGSSKVTDVRACKDYADTNGLTFPSGNGAASWNDRPSGCWHNLNGPGTYVFFNSNVSPADPIIIGAPVCQNE